MLKIYEHDLDPYLHARLTDELKEAVASRQQIYLIVPEQQALTAERDVADKLQAESAQQLEVTNFTRFADTIMRRIGGVCAKYSTPADESLIMWRALTELSGAVTLTKKAKRLGSGTVGRILAAVKELQVKGVSPRELSDIVEPAREKDRRLGEKLDDLSKVYALYKALADARFANIHDTLASVAERISDDGEIVKGHTVIIDGFTSFTASQLKLIGALIKSCDVTIRLSLPRYGAELFEFSQIKQTERQLIREADRRSVTKQIVRDGTESMEHLLLGQISKGLWRSSGTLDNDCLQMLREDGERVRIFSARTPFEECAFIAADIKRRVMDGDSYSDFAIVARDIGSYEGILDTGLADAGICAFISKAKSVSSLEGIKLIDTAYRVVCRGFHREDVLAYMKCGLANIERDERDELERYIKKWSIDTRAFTSDDDWQMNPSGYKARTEDDIKRTERINRLRRQIISPLAGLAAATGKPMTVRKQAEALVAFLDELCLEEKLIARATELHAIGEYSAAEENARLWELICSSLDRLVDILGDITVDAEAFASLLSLLFSDATLGRMPARRDEVLIGSADMLRTYGKKHVYLIGVNYAAFPALPSDSSFFSDKDKVGMHELGLAIEPSLELENANELFFFSRAFSAAESTVTLTYCERSATYSVLTPSEVISRIKDMTCEEVKPRSIASLPMSDRIYTVTDIIRSGVPTHIPSLRALIDKVCCGRISCLCGEDIKNKEVKLSDDTVGILFSDSLYLSQTKLDTFLCCPFSYFAKYGMRLSEDAPAELGADVIGSFIHSVLENFFRLLTERGENIAELSEDDKSELIEAASRGFISDVLSGANAPRTKSAVSRLCRAARPIVDGMCNEFSSCRFRPVMFELSTYGRSPGEAEPVIYTTRDGGSATISGIVDRVDTMKVGDDVYIRVVDYKTGNKIFSPTDIEKGENLQMFLYMKSITETKNKSFRDRIGVGDGGRMIPAGVIYSRTSVKDVIVDHPSDEEAIRKIQEKNHGDGMLLDEEVSLSAMSPSELPLGKDGTIDQNRLYTEEGWSQICNKIEKAVLDIIDEMKRGDMSPRPRRLSSKSYHPCEYCAYKSICRNDEKKKY